MDLPLYTWLYALDSVAALSQCIEIGGIGFGHKGMLINKSLNRYASLQQEAKATNSVTMVESVMQLCFFDPQDNAPPPSVKIQPLMDT